MGAFPISIGAFLRATSRERSGCPMSRRTVGPNRTRFGSGIRLTHLDSHQHVHALPVLAALTQRLAARYGIPFVRVPVEDWRTGRPQNLHGLNRMLVPCS